MKIIIVVESQSDETAHITHTESNGLGYGHMANSGAVIEIDLAKGDSLDIIHSDE